MNWIWLTDIVVFLGGIFFTLALIPAVRQRFKTGETVPLFTSATTAFWLWMFAIVFAGSGLYMAAFAQGITATMWTLLMKRK